MSRVEKQKFKIVLKCGWICYQYFKDTLHANLPWRLVRCTRKKRTESNVQCVGVREITGWCICEIWRRNLLYYAIRTNVYISKNQWSKTKCRIKIVTEFDSFMLKRFILVLNPAKSNEDWATVYKRKFVWPENEISHGTKHGLMLIRESITTVCNVNNIQHSTFKSN